MEKRLTQKSKKEDPKMKEDRNSRSAIDLTLIPLALRISPALCLYHLVMSVIKAELSVVR